MRNKKRNIKKSIKSYKLMKGGSMAGNFFRFLAGENERDKIKLNELKEFDEYNKEKAKKEKEETNKNIDESINRSERRQNEKLIKYKQENDIIDSISDLNRDKEENNEISLLQKGGGLLEDINDSETINFIKWKQGSNEAYNKVVERNDAEKVSPGNWERNIVDGNGFHQVKKTGGRRKIRKSRRKIRKSRRKIRKSRRKSSKSRRRSRSRKIRKKR